MTTKAESASPRYGASRKRRKVRINHSSVVGAIPTFAPSVNEWNRLAKAYGFPIGADDRTSITGAVSKYFEGAVFEPASPFLDDALQWLEDARKSGDKFWRHLFTETNPDPLKNDANFHAQMVLDEVLREFRACSTSEIVSTMTAFMAASVKARTRMIADAERNGFREGDAWTDLVVDLTALMKGAGLPVTVSKAVDKAAHWKPSPFVAFLHALQMIFPPDLRRHMASDVALAEAVTVSRRSRRKINSPGRST